MANKFGHLKQLDVKSDSTADMTLHQIEVNDVSPTLVVRPATDANKPYFNALLKRSGRNMRQVQSGKITAGLIEDNREEDKVLFPKHVVVGWKDMLDEKGKEIPFTEADCQDFVESLPNWLFDDICQFAKNPQNFLNTASVDVQATGNG
jgi:hypothetical protein